MGLDSSESDVQRSAHWSDSKCDYCDNWADMVCAGSHACFEHRERLLKEKGHLAEDAYIKQLKKLGEWKG